MASRERSRDGQRRKGGGQTLLLHRRPTLGRLRLLAIVAPLFFGIGLELFTDHFLEAWFGSRGAHVLATAILTCAVILFTFWIFGVLVRMQTAIDRQRDREQHQAAEMARMEERERIGVALHDGVIQTVYGIQLSLDACLVSLPPDSEAAGCIRASVSRLDSVSERMRQYIHGQWCSFDDEGDLRHALGGLLTIAQATAGVKTEMMLDDVALGEATAPAKHAVFQSARGAIDSALQRGATRIGVLLGATENSISLVVKDNGEPIEKPEEVRLRQSLDGGLTAVSAIDLSIGREEGYSSVTVRVLAA